MEAHRRFCCRKQGEVPRPKPKYVCMCMWVVWMGFCNTGPSPNPTLMGHMDAFTDAIYCSLSVFFCVRTGQNIWQKCMSGLVLVKEEEQECASLKASWKRMLYVEILGKTLIPFVQTMYPEGHKFMQDNDPKNVSGYSQSWMKANKINWWKTPPESPDLNLIENLWHELKEYIRRENP